MSRSASLPVKAPEPLSLLQQRLFSAEKEAGGLIRDMSALGMSRDQIFTSTEVMDTTQLPVNPLKLCRIQRDGQQCGSLESQMCHMENLLQTLKLTIFRLETEKELNPSGTGAVNLKQQLAALQQRSDEEQMAWRREVMKLRDQLQQAYLERDEAHTEVQRLCETVEAATAAKMDVALAAEELKIVKLEMTEKLMEMKENTRQESNSSAEAMKFQSKLLQQVKEMETVVDMERRQALLLQSDCQVLRVEVQSSRQQLEEEKDRRQQLEDHCQQLKEHIAMKDSLISELKTELKRQQTENSKLLKEGRDIRAAAGRVQADRNQVLKKRQEQDLLLTADNVFLQKEVEKLHGEHAQLLQSSSVAQETADTQKELLERIIERLQGELTMAQKKEEVMRKDLEDLKNELCLAVTKLEGEKRSLETQLSHAKQEVGSLRSALQSQQGENRRLMGKFATLEQREHVDQMLRDLVENQPAYEKGKLKISELAVLWGPCGPGQTLVNTLDSHSGLQLNTQTLHQEIGEEEQELALLKKHRLQAQREINKHQVEVEKLQQLLTSSHWKNNRALEHLQIAKVENNRLAQSLEQARDKYQATITLRDKELNEARSVISHLSEELDTVKEQRREDFDSSMKTLHREISELKMTVKDSSTRSGDQAKTSEELRQRVSELERLVSKQKSCVREQRNQLRPQRKGRGLQDNSQEAERIEDKNEQADSKIQELKMNSKQVWSKQEAEMERCHPTLGGQVSWLTAVRDTAGNTFTLIITSTYRRDVSHTHT